MQIDTITKRIADSGYAVSFNPSAWLKVSDQTFRTHLASPSACIMPTSTVIASSECTHSKTYCQLSGIIKASAGASVDIITDQVQLHIPFNSADVSVITGVLTTHTITAGVSVDLANHWYNYTSHYFWCFCLLNHWAGLAPHAYHQSISGDVSVITGALTTHTITAGVSVDLIIGITTHAILNYLMFQGSNVSTYIVIHCGS